MSKLKIIKDLYKKLNSLFKNENTGHDIKHLKRVLKYAVKIQKKEIADFYVVSVSALVHDIHRLMSTKLKRFVTPIESLDNVKQILLECNVDLSKLDKILEVVKNHDNKQNKNFSLETLIIQDADTLDAIGKIGLKRTLKYCKTNSIPIVSPLPLDTTEYIPDVNPISTCHYIFRTMIPNSKNLYTNSAKKIAKNKVKVLENFIKKRIN